MALTTSVAPALIADSSLEGWVVIGSGGFGQIYKARHCQWCCDVAVKLLHYDDGTSSSLLREVEMMRQGSSPYVIQVLGVFKGRLPTSGPSAHLGLVMEFMERGTLASLQDTLHGAPPWPLVFRLAHQVALGINFLHSLSPALLHLDLKPSNVLLDSYLNAKLTDFGLARFYHSIKRMSKRNTEEEGGTISYMPPEAFGVSYSPTRASDIYSYGILLWSLVTGKQPYPNAMSSIVRFRIPQGDRPSLDEIRGQSTGLTGLMDLMVKCWEQRPAQRPTSRECTTVSEELFKMHKHAIIDSVHQVLKKLDQREQDRRTDETQRFDNSQTSAVNAGFQGLNLCDSVPTGRPPVQENAGGLDANYRDKTRVKDLPSTRPKSMCHIDQNDRTPSGFKVKSSSVHPIHSFVPSQSPPTPLNFPTPPTPLNFPTPPNPPTPPKPPNERSPQGRPAHISQPAQFQRQFSSPDTFSCHSPSTRGLCINLSNVVGFQQGNNNTMFINDYAAESLERRRHPTAPSSVNLSPPRGRQNTGGAG